MASPPQSAEEVIDHDDLCHICHLLLHHPVTTKCGHTFCETCFTHWTDVSTSQMIADLDIDIDPDHSFTAPIALETRCPMCRTLTTATPNTPLTSKLATTYPTTSHQRTTEASLSSHAQIEDADGSLIEPLTLYIGNTHTLLRHDPASTTSSSARNRHDWTFFIRPSNTSMIEEIQVFLHPTFKTSDIILSHPPYSIRRVGWGVFTIFVNVILKAGYSWMSPEAEDTADGAVKGKLPLEWVLDFRGRGSQGRVRLRVRREKEGVDGDVQRGMERSRRAWNRARVRDPDYVPGDEC